MRKKDSADPTYSSSLPKILTLSLLLLLAPLGFSSVVNAGTLSCAGVMSSESVPWGTLSPEFIHNDHYSVLVADQSAIKDQCNLGTCHLHSWASMLEQDRKQDHLRPVTISTRYLSAQRFLQQSLKLLDSPLSPSAALELGATVFGSRDAILAAGLVPDSVWQPQSDFDKDPLASRLAGYVQNIIARTKNLYSLEPDDLKRKVIIETGKQEIRGLVRDVVGQFPEKFTYAGRKYTPQEFQKEFYPYLERPIVNLQVSTAAQPRTSLENIKESIVIETSMDQFAETARRLLDQGENIYLSYEHNRQFVDKKSGIMSISAFRVPESGLPVEKSLRKSAEISRGGHAVQIVGYDADPRSGKVVKWKIKNSWGTGSGDNGYFHMYDDYFRTYANSLNFYRDAKVPLPEIQWKVPEQKSFDF